MEAQVSIAKRSDGWVISVDGVEILTCSLRSVAIEIVKTVTAREPDIRDAVITPADAECLPAATLG